MRARLTGLAMMVVGVSLAFAGIRLYNSLDPDEHPRLVFLLPLGIGIGAGLPTFKGFKLLVRGKPPETHDALAAPSGAVSIEPKPGSDGERMLCAVCGREIRSRASFANQKIGGVVTGDALFAQFEALEATAYRCRNCGRLRCKGCAGNGGPCPCGGDGVFDSI